MILLSIDMGIEGYGFADLQGPPYISDILLELVCLTSFCLVHRLIRYTRQTYGLNNDIGGTWNN
jgi:hypothetical protein